MNSFMQLLTIINLIFLIYLTYIVYKKNRQTNTPKDISSISLDTKQRISLTHFNPFDEVGGDQSFILVILDGQDSGVIITSLHNRDLTRVYAKPIKAGQGDGVTLSKEEKLAVSKIVKSYNQ